MAGTLRVDTVQLDTLGTQLGNVRDRLADTRSELDAHEGAIGSNTVVDAVRGFEDHWARGRRELTESADALAQMVVDSAANYVDTDGQLATGLTSQSTDSGASSATSSAPQ